MNRAERLLNLVAALLETRRLLTADELYEQVPGYTGEPASVRRAFERDKETLREMGIPITSGPIDDQANIVGYRIKPEDYQLQDPGLAADELAALHLAASAVRLDGGHGMEALWKLGGELTGADPGSAPVASLPGAEVLAPLFGAVSERRAVAFGYRGARRTLDPYGLSFRNGHWYVSGRDHDRDEVRQFRLDRVDGDVEPVGPPGAFEATATGDQPHPWRMGDEELVTATLLVDAGQAGWAIGQVGAEAVQERKADGSVVLELPVTNRAAFRSFVLGFLDHAEVLAPAALRDDMVAWLELVASH
ncbi:MAG: putative transcriptional regulator [Acidimicrobiales bacterium]|jgi:proteasome accessory factor B|nr:putative transcriptional regulator [Acidimicrobiales bacterium]